MKQNEKRRKTTIYVNEDLHREVRIRSAHDDISFQDVTEEALRLWVKEFDKKHPKPAAA